MRRVWSESECNLLVADYVEMLKAEVCGAEYSKAAHYRNLMPRLDRRKKGAIEFKHQNVSAVLDKLGFRYIEGYKPRRNHQLLLKKIVQVELRKHPTLARQLSKPR